MKEGKRGGVELTVEIGRKIVDAIRAGNFTSAACRMADVSESTVEKWLKRGGRGVKVIRALQSNGL
jgi:transposase